MDLLYPAPPPSEGLSVITSPPLPLKWLGLSRLMLKSTNDSYAFETDQYEIGMDLLYGTCKITLRGPWGESSYSHIGERLDPFSGPPNMVYIPRETEGTVTCITGPLEALVVRAPAQHKLTPRLITFDSVIKRSFGRDNWERAVYASIGPDIDTDRIMMGETHTPSGNWSSYPPHKHDVERDGEIPSEEIYHFLIEPPHGFGVQCLWTAADYPAEKINETYRLHHRDTVLIPGGYHPVSVAPGFRMITVWAFAGEKRAWESWKADPTFTEALE
jgi:5-deoxy-glucuronate isomerase